MWDDMKTWLKTMKTMRNTRQNIKMLCMIKQNIWKT